MQNKNDSVILRIGKHSLGFATLSDSEDSGVRYEPYILNSSISIAANLREAFKRSELTEAGIKNAVVLIDSNVMLIPTDEYVESEISSIYRHSFAVNNSQQIVESVVPQLSCVAAYAVDSDLITVVNDNFSHSRIFPLTFDTWTIFANKSHSPSCRRLFAYLHDGKVETTAYGNQRFKFHNTFEIKHPNDAIYYVLSVWKQLGYDQETDELYLAGAINDNDDITNGLCKYLKGVFTIRPKIDFIGHRAVKNERLPYDLLCYIINNC